jgi:hypothetical protein
VGDELASQPVELVELALAQHRRIFCSFATCLVTASSTIWKPAVTALSAIGRLRRYPAVQRDSEPASVGAGWEAKAQS